MGKSLSEIVSAAIGSADAQLKLASAHDAVVRNDGDFLAAELAIPSTRSPKEIATPEPQARKTASAVLDDAAHGLQIADALDAMVGVFSKFAADAISAPGPAVLASGHINEKTVSPKAQSSHKEPASVVTTTSTGPNGMATNESEYRDPDWTKNKEAADAYVSSKVAQAQMLRELGQEAAAQRIEAEIAKIAAGELSTEGGGASRIPDNAGLIAMTKAQAKDPSTREARAFFSEPARRDNAVPANVSHTEGQKLSKKEQHSRIPASAIGALLGGAPGAAIGGGIEGARHGEPGFGMLRGGGGAAGGGMLGGLTAGALGHLGGRAAGLHGTKLDAAMTIPAVAAAAHGTVAGAHAATKKYREPEKHKTSGATKALLDAAKRIGPVAPGSGGTISNLIGARQPWHVAQAAGRRLGHDAGRAARPNVLGGIKVSADNQKLSKKEQHSRVPASAIGALLGGAPGGAIGGGIEGARRGEPGIGMLRGGGGTLGGNVLGALAGGALGHVGGHLAGLRGAELALASGVPAGLGAGIGGIAGAHAATKKYRESKRDKSASATSALLQAAKRIGPVAPKRLGEAAAAAGKKPWLVAPAAARNLGVSAGRAARPNVLGGIKV